MHIHPRSIAHKVFDIWRSPGRFTKNPDIIDLPTGRLLLIYSDTDAHWSQEDQVLTLLASDDRVAPGSNIGRSIRPILAMATNDWSRLDSVV